MKDAVLLNTRGTHELLKIAENLKHLEAFIHVSTTFINPDKKVIEEKVINTLIKYCIDLYLNVSNLIYSFILLLLIGKQRLPLLKLMMQKL